MFVFSVKPNKQKILLYTIFGIVVLVCALFLFMGREKKVTTDKKSVANIQVENNAERIAWLKSYQWVVDEEPLEIVDVAIPNEFNDTYNNYNEIQKKQGFDLEIYKGKKAKRYTYSVRNYPTFSQEVRANILVFENKIIGGDICSAKLDGFMHGFSRDNVKKNSDKL